MFKITKECLPCFNDKGGIDNNNDKTNINNNNNGGDENLIIKIQKIALFWKSHVLKKELSIKKISSLNYLLRPKE